MANNFTTNGLLQTLSGQLPSSVGPQARASSLSAVLANTLQPTYSAVITGYTAYATPTDILILNGSASKTVYVTSIVGYLSATAATPMAFSVIKRSAVNTGGTPSAATIIPLDSSDAAATATLNTFGAAPTTGTAIGTLAYLAGTATAATTQAGVVSLNSITARDTARGTGDLRKPMTLIGAAQGLAINFGGSALPAGFTSTWVVEWVEV